MDSGGAGTRRGSGAPSALSCPSVPKQTEAALPTLMLVLG